MLKDKDGSWYHPVADTERPEKDVAQCCTYVVHALLACGKYVDGITAAGDEPLEIPRTLPSGVSRVFWPVYGGELE